MYATVTSKGQVTLPVELRRSLKVEPGQMVGFRVEGDHAVMEAPPDLESVRDRLEQAARRNGTWGVPYDMDDVRHRMAVKRYEDSIA